MSFDRENSGMEIYGIIRFCEILLIISLVTAIIVSGAIPFNYRDTAAFVVSIMTLCINFMTMAGCGIVLFIFKSKKHKGKKV